MREFFINSFEKLISVIIVLMAIGIVVAAVAAMSGMGGMMGPGGQSMGGGLVSGLVILLVGAIYLIFFGGAMYLALGIYQNTRETAEALKKLAARG